MTEVERIARLETTIAILQRQLLETRQELQVVRTRVGNNIDAMNQVLTSLMEHTGFPTDKFGIPAKVSI